MTCDDVATSWTSPRVPPSDNSRADVVTGRNPGMEVLSESGQARGRCWYHRLVPLIAGGRPARFPRWPLLVRAARARTRATRRPGRKQYSHGRNSPRSKSKKDFSLRIPFYIFHAFGCAESRYFAIRHNVLT